MQAKIGQIKVVSFKQLSDSLSASDIRVDRASVLGNPFELKVESDRDYVIDNYRLWLWANIQTKSECIIIPNQPVSKKWKKPMSAHVYRELCRIESKVKNGEDVNLVCWCAPKRCHADVIKSCIAWMCSK